MKPWWLLLPLLLPIFAQAECKSAAAEPFERFIGAFTENKAFAVSRTHYPLVSLRHEVSYEEDREILSAVETYISKAKDVGHPSMGAFAHDNAMQLRTSELQKRSATVRMEKPDTDWLLTYHFVRKGPCWYLQRIEDHSL